MAEIAGMLLSDLCPDGTVRISFITRVETGNEPAVKVKNLDMAEADFVHILGLTPDLAAALRGGLERNKAFCLTMNLEEKIAAIFAPHKPNRDRFLQMPHFHLKPS